MLGCRKMIQFLSFSSLQENNIFFCTSLHCIMQTVYVQWNQLLYYSYEILTYGLENKAERL